MGKIIAIGGGNNGGDFDVQLEETIRSFIEKEQPLAVFIPYASLDYQENYKQFKELYESLGYEVRLLQPGDEEMLVQADLIYLGRGWTIPLLKELEKTNAKALIVQAFHQGTIIVGFSAGAHALFTLAGSNEEEVGYTLVKGMGFINACMISHYNYKDRAEAFHQLLLKTELLGVGLEDHTMMVVENGVARVYSSTAEANGYVIKRQGSNVVVESISGKDLELANQ